MIRIILFLLVITTSFANDTINVVVNKNVPFIMRNPDGELVGYDIDLWNSIAKKLKVETNYIEVDHFSDIFTYLDSNKADIAISSISITAPRFEKYNFSYPYKTSGIGAMVRSEQGNSIISSMKVAFGKDFVPIWIAFMIFIIVMANLIWIVERISDIYTKDTRSDTFNDKYYIGIFESLWYVIITITTVGYGDKVPKHIVTKFLAAILAVVGISFAGVAISQLSSTLSVQEAKYTYNTISDLVNKKVAYVDGTTSKQTVVDINAVGIPVTNLDSAYKLLITKKVDAVLFDEPSLRYFKITHNDVSVLNDITDLQTYGIMMNDTKYTNKINIQILKCISNRTIKELETKYFGNNQ